MKTCTKKRFYSLCDSIGFHKKLIEPFIFLNDDNSIDDNMTKLIRELTECNKKRFELFKKLNITDY